MKIRTEKAKRRNRWRDDTVGGDIEIVGDGVGDGAMATTRETV